MPRTPAKLAIALACGTGLLLASGAALANHWKAGLWQISVTMQGVNMPNMANLPPEALAAMKAHGVTMGGNSISSQTCMKGTEFSANNPPPMGRHNKDCTLSNMSNTGGHFVADMACTNSSGSTSGHIDYAFDSDEHFTAHIHMTIDRSGHSMTNDETVEGRYVSADCAGH